MVTNQAALRFMRRMMDEHGLNDWNPQLLPMPGKVWGLCKYDAKLICVSQPFLKRASFEEFRQVVLHEIAHELDRRWYGNQGHGRTFAMACRRIGCVYEGPIAHYIKDEPVEFKLVLFTETSAIYKRDVPADFDSGFETMKVVPATAWNDYLIGQIDHNELKTFCVKG